MSRSLTVQLPDNAYESMVHTAHIRGESLEALASQVLTSRFSDPLLALSGCILSPLTDVAERHDHYLGEGLAATHDE